MRVAEANGDVMPEWVPYSESDECQLCKADFTWASTSKSEVCERTFCFVHVVRGAYRSLFVTVLSVCISAAMASGIELPPGEQAPGAASATCS